jgi:hypothetical protein
MAENESFLMSLLKKVLTILFKKIGFSKGASNYHQHVVPYKGNWAIKMEGSEKVTEIFDNQEEAIERAKIIAYNHRSDVIIHRKDGTIRDRIEPRRRY